MATAVQEQVDTGLQGWLESFTEAERQAPGRSLPWLRKLREDGFARFYETGFPTTHDEDWRFTNIAGIARTVFRVAGAATIVKADVAEWIVEGAAARLVFVNGRFVPSLSALKSLPTGVTVASLREQIEAASGDGGEAPGALCGYAARRVCRAEHGVRRAMARIVHVARGVVVHAPIYLLYLSTQEETPSMTHPRNLIVAEDESQVTVVEDYGLGGRRMRTVLSNAVTELVAGESAVAQHFLIEREHLKAFNMSTLRIEQGRSANVSSHSVLLGGGLVRNNVHPVLAGEGGECLINGLFLGTGPAASGQLHACGARSAALRKQAVLQRHSGWARARRVSRAHCGAQAGAEDRCETDESEPAAERRRADRHQAAAGNLCGRCEVHARRNDWADRRERAVLPADRAASAKSRRATCC